MINDYGADSVRWFILSDSPPEKDVQWSDIGVASANKFLQKIWNLNFLISTKNEDKINKVLEKKFSTNIDVFVNKIDRAINDFRFNVAIAHFYEIYNYFKDNINKDISNIILKENIIKTMKIMIPFIPHLANECLELLGCKTKNIWPRIEKTLVSDVKLAVQINGKTRDIITIKRDTIESDIYQVVMENSKTKKYLNNKTISKTIFIKNKIINYIIRNS